MDPLSAFALAGTVYTFIDAGITATKFAKELSGFWKSSRDTVKSLEHLTITTQDLEELSSKLRHANGPRYMMSIATECTTSCQELLDLLDKLKVKDKGSKTEHLLAMLSAYRKKDEISLIEDKLGKLRAQMTLDLLRALNDGQSDIKGKLDEIQNDIVKLSETRHGSFRARRAGLLDLLQAYKQNQDQDHSAIINELRNFGSEVYHERVFNSILKTLRFDSMYLREDNTSEAGEGTFRWLFDKQERFKATNPRSNNMPPQKFQETRDAFMMWLESGEGVFHICGKAGSGKSTLMKLICNDKQTRNALNAWAEGDTLLWANFFFFAPGEKEVKSLEGLYRFVLFTILNEHRHLIRKVYPDEFPEEFKEFRHDRQLAYELADLVRPPKLREAFQSLIDVTVADKHKMCIFIDGLDEYEGSYTDYWQLADNLRDWAHQSCARVKFCVSSRPEVQFESTFSSKNAPTIRQIHLHEFTSGDIEKYCRDQFTKTSNSKMIPNYDNFIDHIVTKAQGVFLWAVLVTKELLFETRITHSAKDLWRKLDELPDELHELYQKLFDSMGEAQRRRCCRILLTVLTNPFKDPINAQSLNWIYDEEDLDQALFRQLQCSETHGPEQHVNRVVDHLNEWTRGFVEAIAWDQSTETSTSLTNLPHFHTRVRLFHKTVKDYMDSSKLSMLQSEFPGFDVVKTHVQLRLLELGIVNAQYKENHVFEFYNYGYEILESDLEGSLGNDKQISWPICEMIGLHLPTRGRTSGLAKPNYAGRMDIHSTEKTSLPHLLAYFGYPEALQGQHLRDCSRKGLTEDNGPAQPKRKSLLLSACIGMINLTARKAFARASRYDETIAKAIDLGYTAHDRVMLIEDDDKSTCPSMTIWQIVVLVLILQAQIGPWLRKKSKLRNSSALSQLFRLLSLLLACESQEEVFIIFTTGKGRACCMTLYDLVEGYDPSKSRNSLLRLLGDGPQYKTEKLPSWLYNTYAEHHRSEKDVLERWNPRNQVHTGALGGDIAVVSGKSILLSSHRWTGIDVEVW